MKILIIEDDAGKSEAINDEVKSRIGERVLCLKVAATMAMASKLIHEQTFDLIILDLMIPYRDGDQPVDVSDDLLGLIQNSEKNSSCRIISITGFDDLVDEKIRRFAENGVSLVIFDEELGQWKQTLALELERIKYQVSIDFVFICALEKERQAFKHTAAELGVPFNHKGLDCIPMQVGTAKGICVKTGRMGLVETAIATTRSIEFFDPSVIAMSGICAGFPGEVSLGTLIVSDLCWNYQTGKWGEEGLKPEVYSVSISPEARNLVSTELAIDSSGKAYKENLMCEAIDAASVILAPTTSGSAVISDSNLMKSISGQHRKLAGLDMELFALYQATALAPQKPVFFGAKTVVDLGDSEKNDHLHLPGAIFSARYVVAIMEKLLS